MFGCWYECFKISTLIIKRNKVLQLKQLLIECLTLSLLIAFTINQYQEGDHTNSAFYQSAWWILLFFITLYYFSLLIIRGIRFLFFSLLPTMYIFVPIVLGMVYLYFIYPSYRVGNFTIPLLPTLVFLVVWLNDSMAYFIGSWIGKTPLTSISPKKTVEGSLGGLLVSVVLLTILLQPIHPHTAINILMVTVASIVSILGDLVESKLKRLASIKDSGFFLPGHGGFLDRFDSFLITATALFLFQLLHAELG